MPGAAGCRGCIRDEDVDKSLSSWNSHARSGTQKIIIIVMNHHITDCAGSCKSCYFEKNRRMGEVGRLPTEAGVLEQVTLGSAVGAEGASHVGF